MECAGIHRGLGAHISKVKSLQIDKWDIVLIQVGIVFPSKNLFLKF